MATTKGDLEAFYRCTLFASDKQAWKILDKHLIENSTLSQNTCNPIGICMRYLLTKEFVRLQMNDSTKENNFIATRLGSACLGNPSNSFVCRTLTLNKKNFTASSLSPNESLTLRADLQKASESIVVETDLHIVYLVIPLSICDELYTMDWRLYLDLWQTLPASMRRVGSLVGVRDAKLLKAIQGRTLDDNIQQTHIRLALGTES